MKHPIKHLVKQACLITTLSTLLTLAALPGQAAGPVSTTLTTAYQSRYVLYGYRLSRHLYSADLYLYAPASERMAVWGGGWYGYLTDGTYQEIDVYGGIDYTINATFSAGISYALFNYLEVPFETSDHVSEFTAHATAATGPITLGLRAHYDTEAEGALLRGQVSTAHPLTTRWTLQLQAEAGYAIDYFIDSNAWNHANTELALTFQASPAISLTPYIAHSWPLAAIDAFEQNETYGGLRVAYTF